MYVYIYICSDESCWCNTGLYAGTHVTLCASLQTVVSSVKCSILNMIDWNEFQIIWEWNGFDVWNIRIIHCSSITITWLYLIVPYDGLVCPSIAMRTARLILVRHEVCVLIILCFWKITTCGPVCTYTNTGHYVKFTFVVWFSLHVLVTCSNVRGRLKFGGGEAFLCELPRLIYLCLCVRATDVSNLMFLYQLQGGTRWRSWLRYCATSRKVAGSIPDDVTGFFHWHNPSGRTMALGLTQHLTKMSTRNISWGEKAAGA